MSSASLSAGSYGSVRLFSAAGVDDDTHDDFKPQVKGGPSASLVDQIEDDIKTHDVFLYMKARRGGRVLGRAQLGTHGY